LAKISVSGCGRLGAVHAAAMAELGHDDVGIEVNLKRLGELQRGHSPFYDAGLEELLAKGIESGRLTFSNNIADVGPMDVHSITVGTPTASNGVSADLSFVDAAIEGLIPHLKSDDVIVGKSTCSHWNRAEGTFAFARGRFEH